MNLSDKGLDLIKSFEGCVLHAYPDPASGGEPYTIGYGHTGGVKPGDTCTQERADDWLRADVRYAVAAVNHLVTVELEQHQFDPLVSLTYNIGQVAFGNSTLLRFLNLGNFNAVPEQIRRWDKGPNGQPLPGLTRRRHAEAAMFSGEAA